MLQGVAHCFELVAQDHQNWLQCLYFPTYDKSSSVKCFTLIHSIHMALFKSISLLNRVLARSLRISVQRCGHDDLSSKRMGAVAKTDIIEGERDGEVIGSKISSIAYVSPNLENMLFDGVKFKDIPILFIICTSNNTKMGVTLGNGRPIMLKSAGTEGFKNCRKGTTVAAQAIANRILGMIKDVDINQVRLVFDGLGPGRNAAFKAIEVSGLKVVSLSDRTQADEPWILRPRRPKSL